MIIKFDVTKNVLPGSVVLFRKRPSMRICQTLNKSDGCCALRWQCELTRVLVGLHLPLTRLLIAATSLWILSKNSTEQSFEKCIVLFHFIFNQLRRNEGNRKIHMEWQVSKWLNFEKKWIFYQIMSLMSVWFIIIIINISVNRNEI